jgi:hypothetical protein
MTKMKLLISAIVFTLVSTRPSHAATQPVFAELCPRGWIQLSSGFRFFVSRHEETQRKVILCIHERICKKTSKPNLGQVISNWAIQTTLERCITATRFRRLGP